MAAYLIDRGFPADRLMREDQSHTTQENLQFSKQLIDKVDPASPCMIVTNNFHAFRAALPARRVGLDGQVVGTPTATYYWPSATLREFAAVLILFQGDQRLHLLPPGSGRFGCGCHRLIQPAADPGTRDRLNWTHSDQA
jgi:uncharacterized SAM-binding protein YcdF (DUF218 family)